MNRFFHRVIEPCLQALPVLRVIHSETHNGRNFQLTQTVKRNVYTEFDRCLSRHLAATTGDAFPAYTVSVVVSEADSKAMPRHIESGFHDSVPHALKELAERAFTRVGPVELAFYRSSLKDGADPSVAQKRKVDRSDIDMLGTALKICENVGDGEFLDVSGDFGMVVAQPPGKLDPIVLQLNKGTVLVPSSTMPGSAPFQWSLYSFFEHSATNLAAQSYMAGVSQSLLQEKEKAIREFRASAERRVVDFHQALGGRSLNGHWLESAQGLLERLKAGLGDGYAGIADDARGIALDLYATLEQVSPGWQVDDSKHEKAVPKAKAVS